MTPPLRKFLVIASVVFAIAVPALQMGLQLGLSAGEFAGDGNSTLRAAGYAFSIWSVIYAGLIAYAVWQALPRNAGDPLLAQIAWPSVVAISGCGLWIIASSADWKWASVAIIAVSAATLTLALIRLVPVRAELKARVFVWWPLSLLAGWLTIASAINILTVLTATGLIGGTSAVIAGYVGVGAVVVVALLVLEKRPKPFPGRTFWSFAFLYSVLRFIIEFYRGDDRGLVLDLLSTSQFISVVLGPLSLIMLWYLSRANRPAAPEVLDRAHAPRKPRFT